MINGSRVAIYEPNEAMLEFGEENRSFFVIIDGEAEVAVTDDRGEKPSGSAGIRRLLRRDFTHDRRQDDCKHHSKTRCTVLVVPDHLLRQ